jgi:hypothetical protein
MFTLTIHDRKGTQLKEGDIVKVSDMGNFNFYAEVKFLEPEKVLAPFQTFSFHSFEKVDRVPDGALKSTEDRYGIWYLPDEVRETYEDGEQFNDYLMSWRACETPVERRAWRITKQ